MPSFTVERPKSSSTSSPITADKAFTPPRTSELEREGTPPLNAVGAIRALGVVGPPLREEITVYELPVRFGYRLRSGMPVRGHVAEWFRGSSRCVPFGRVSDD